MNKGLGRDIWWWMIEYMSCTNCNKNTMKVTITTGTKVLDCGTLNKITICKFSCEECGCLHGTTSVSIPNSIPEADIVFDNYICHENIEMLSD